MGFIQYFADSTAVIAFKGNTEFDIVITTVLFDNMLDFSNCNVYYSTMKTGVIVSCDTTIL